MTTPRLREWWALLARRPFLAACIGLAAMWSLASLTLPFGWDQGIMATVGDVVVHGGMPYRDAWDIKGPLAHLWFAAAQAVFGRGQAGIRVLDLLLLVWAAVALGAAGARLTRPAAGPWIALGLVLCHSSLSYFYSAQPDGAMSLALVLGLAPLLAAPARPRHSVVAGLVVGLGILLKPLYLAFLALPLAVVLFAPEVPRRKRAGQVALVLAATLAPIVCMLIWFGARGALNDLIAVYLRYNAESYSGVDQLDARKRLAELARYFWSGPRAPALALLVFGSFQACRRNLTSGAIIIGWLLAGVALVVVQGKFFVYHWTVIFPASVLLVAVAIDALLPRPPVHSASTSAVPGTRSLRVLAYAALAAIVLPLAVQPAFEVKNWLRLVARVDSAPAYYARFSDAGFSAADQMAAAAYLRAHTTAGDRIAILGYDAPVVYLSGRTNATRFAYALPLVGWRSAPATREAYQREFLAGLTPPPAYIIVGLLFPGKAQALSVFPEFGDLLAARYALERSFGVVDLYHRVR